MGSLERDTCGVVTIGGGADDIVYVGLVKEALSLIVEGIDEGLGNGVLGKDLCVGIIGERLRQVEAPSLE